MPTTSASWATTRVPEHRVLSEQDLISTVAALSTVYRDARDIFDLEVRRLNMVRPIAKMPTMAAYAYRHSLGFPMCIPTTCCGTPRTS